MTLLILVRVLHPNPSLKLILILILLRQKKVKKESSNPSPPLKKKSKSHITAKSQEATDIETPPLVSAPISKKKKRSLKSLPQDDQSRVKNIIEKIIETVLNEKFGTIIAFFQLQNSASR